MGQLVNTIGSEVQGRLQSLDIEKANAQETHEHFERLDWSIAKKADASRMQECIQEVVASLWRPVSRPLTFSCSRDGTFILPEDVVPADASKIRVCVAVHCIVQANCSGKALLHLDMWTH